MLLGLLRHSSGFLLGQLQSQLLLLFLLLALLLKTLLLQTKLLKPELLLLFVHSPLQIVLEPLHHLLVHKLQLQLLLVDDVRLELMVLGDFISVILLLKNDECHVFCVSCLPVNRDFDVLYASVLAKGIVEHDLGGVWGKVLDHNGVKIVSLFGGLVEVVERFSVFEG